MKITKTQLRKMIKEELLKEAEGWFPDEAKQVNDLLSRRQEEPDDTGTWRGQPNEVENNPEDDSNWVGHKSHY